MLKRLFVCFLEIGVVHAQMVASKHLKVGLSSIDTEPCDEITEPTDAILLVLAVTGHQSSFSGIYNQWLFLVPLKGGR